MRSSVSALCSIFCLSASQFAYTQTSTPPTALPQTPTSFLLQAQAAVSGGKAFRVVNLTATAEWIAGSLHESGTAQLQADAGGSTNVQLALGQASRTEVRTKADPSRTCTWIDSAGTNHDIVGPNCFIAIPWFAPSLVTQSAIALPTLLGTTDDGTVSKDNATFHQMSYLLKLTGADSASTNQMVSQSTVKVFYDPQTFLPVSLEYFIYPDNDYSQSIPVRVAFSNYQSVTGVMLPFHIERYINRTLQLKLDVTSASVE
jgi:hypothetical protein